MGTRNLTMVISNGKTKVAQYGQWDGYPEGQGKTVVEFLRRCDLAEFKNKVDVLTWITDKQAAKIEKDPNWDVNYPYLSRDAGATILHAIYDGEMQVSDGYQKKKTVKVDVIGLSNSEDFAGDSLFCEWAYIIDLDKNVLEVYKGFHTSPLNKKDRFYKYMKDDRANKKYYPIRILKTYPLSEIPTVQQFLSYFKKEEEKEEVA